MEIRRERPGDEAVIRAVHAAAFRQPEQPDTEPAEGPLVDTLRAGPDWLPALSFVLVEDAQVVGHVVCTRAAAGGAPVLGLGPIGVRPDRQGGGRGSALMHAVLGAADAVGEPLVGLLGRPEYYGRFGFRPATEAGLLPPVDGWGRYFQVRTLTAYDPSVHGTFRFSPPFDSV